jgi:hypothetical protein
MKTLSSFPHWSTYARVKAHRVTIRTVGGTALVSTAAATSPAALSGPGGNGPSDLPLTHKILLWPRTGRIDPTGDADWMQPTLKKPDLLK